MSYSHDSEQFYVPSRHLGLIIGKGGSRIKELSEEFNCRINIKKDDARDDEVPITFEGDPSDIRRAKEKIKDITKRNVKRHFDDDNNDRNYGRDRDRDNGHKRQSRREDSGDNWGRKSDNKRDDSDEYNSGKQNNSRKYDHYDRNERRDDRRDDRRNDNRNGGYSNQKRVTNDSDDWGAWGEKKVEENTVDTLTFGDEPVMSFSKYLPPSSDNYIPDDDWGIPNFFDDQKPVRSRPSNADCKMRARKDKAMYPILRNFYREHPSVARMSSEERDAFLKAKNNIMIKEVSSEDNQTFCNFGTLEADDETCEDNVEIIQVPKIVPNPIRTFEEAFYDHPDIMREIHKQKFQDPSPIQCIAWPVLMSGRDFIGIAQTGTGKTLAFLLPAFFHIEGQRKPRENRIGPTVLILSPTRELAIQIQNEVQKYTYHDIDSVVCYGGSDKREQIYQLKDNPEIVVGTPGRIQDLKDSGVLNLKDVSYLVLDEADRMLDMGFEIQVVNLIYAVRKHRQTIMTSATWPFSVQRIALTHMQDPVQVNVGTLDLNACHSVSQYVEYINEDDKMDRLCDILSAIEPDDKIIIFVGKKAKCRDLAYDLLIKRSNGKLGPKGACRACEIHGDLDQQEREIALRMMRSGARNVMIATDVASRGLDICDLTKVINYDFPKNIEEYVHRVGRTGRAGRTGESFTFMSNFDSKHAAELIRILEDANQEVPSFLPDLMRQHQDYRINGGGGGFRNGRGGGGGFRGRGGGRGGGGRFNRYDNDGPAPRYDDSSAAKSPLVIDANDDEEDWGNWDKKSDHSSDGSLNNDEKLSTPGDELTSLQINDDPVDKCLIRKSQPKNVLCTSSFPIKKRDLSPETLENKKFYGLKPYLVANKDRNLYPIVRNFYSQHKEIEQMTEEQVEQIMLKHNNIMMSELNTFPLNMQSTDSDNDDVDESSVVMLPCSQCPIRPVLSFHHAFHTHPEILSQLQALGYAQPTPIQMIGWPVLLGGRDFIGIAQTGTGKTLTFVLPALIHIDGQTKPRQFRFGPTVLILSPTRELAMQIEGELDKIKYHRVTSVCCYGGADKQSQVNLLRNNPEIVVGTPGRLNDLMEMGRLCLRDVSYLVLDEADRMLDMGFERQIISLIERTRHQRQTVMTSATWPPHVRSVARLYMNQPVQINIGTVDLVACTAVRQELRRVENEFKTDELVEVIKEMGALDKTIVFVTRKLQCRNLCRHLEHLAGKFRLGEYAVVTQINGDMSQEARESSLDWFKQVGGASVLIATDVASRGLDIADISCVVNYDFPKNIEEYVHRVGRTGRAGRAGRAVTFINDSDARFAEELRSILLQSDQEVPPWLGQLSSVLPCESSPVLTHLAKVRDIKQQFGFQMSDEEYGDWGGNGSSDDNDFGFVDAVNSYMSNNNNNKKKKKKNTSRVNPFARPINLEDELCNDIDEDDEDFFDNYQSINDPLYANTDAGVENTICQPAETAKEVYIEQDDDDDEDNGWW